MMTGRRGTTWQLRTGELRERAAMGLTIPVLRSWKGPTWSVPTAFDLLRPRCPTRCPSNCPTRGAPPPATTTTRSPTSWWTSGQVTAAALGVSAELGWWYRRQRLLLAVEVTRRCDCSAVSAPARASPVDRRDGGPPASPESETHWRIPRSDRASDRGQPARSADHAAPPPYPGDLRDVSRTSTRFGSGAVSASLRGCRRRHCAGCSILRQGGHHPDSMPLWTIFTK